MIRQLVEKTRTIRRFQENRPIAPEILVEILQLSRFGGSARNGQPLRYMIVTDEAVRQQVFPHLGWAGYLPEWHGPDVGERPTAYIVCLLAKKRCLGPEHEAHFDLGISTQSMLLGGAEKGIFGCRIGSFSAKLNEILQIDEDHTILLVLALGYPAETVVIDDMAETDSVRYWRDAGGVHHVPKRKLQDLLYPSPDTTSYSKFI